MAERAKRKFVDTAVGEEGDLPLPGIFAAVLVPLPVLTLPIFYTFFRGVEKIAEFACQGF